MSALLGLIGKLFGRLMLFIYSTIGANNYALSLVIMTLIYKLLTLPLSINQAKSSQKMKEWQPELQRIQERYKNDKQRLQEEQAKFYEEKGYNPMKGCLPMLIQFPIIIALFYVIRMPMAYMMKTPAAAVTHMVIQSVEEGYLNENTLKDFTFKEIKELQNKDDSTVLYLQETYKSLTKKDPYIEIKVLEVANRYPEIVNENFYLSQEQKDVLLGLDLRMFKVFNLGVKPTFELAKIKEDPATFLPPLLLLLIAVATTYFTSSLLMGNQQLQAKDKDGNPVNTGCAGKAMLWMSPIMTLVIGSQTPSGLAVYWTINNIISFAQQKVINNIYSKNDDNQQDKAEQRDTKGQLNSNDPKGSKKQLSIESKNGSNHQHKPKDQKEEKKSAKVRNKRGKKRR